MKLETYLNALMFAKVEISLGIRGYIDMDIEQAKRRSRQVQAFRDRIIRMVEEKDDVIEGQFKSIVRQQTRISELRVENRKLLEKLGVSTTWS